MEHITQPIFSCRIRVKSGDLKDSWLWTMNATRGNVPVTSPIWDGILRQATQYTFHPKFQEKSAAMLIKKDIAEGFVMVLKQMGIDAEVVENQ